jgi:hypothetical protein
MKYLFFLFFTLPAFCFAQSTFIAKAHGGYSRPVGLNEFRFFNVYETGGKFSKNFYLAFEKKMKRHTLRVQSGLTFLGFQERGFDGFTTVRNDKSRLVDVPKFYREEYDITYLDNSLGYGFNLTPDVRVVGALHHFFNVQSELTIFMPAAQAPIEPLHKRENIFNINSSGGSSRRFFLLKDNNKFYNHFAASVEFDYAPTKNLKIGLSYQIGLSRYRPFTDVFIDVLKDKVRLNQNFSVFIAHSLYAFK